MSSGAPLPEEQIRRVAWDNVVHSEGTRTVFQLRVRRLKRWVRIRDYLSIAVPIIGFFIYATDWLNGAFRPWMLGTIGIAGLAQILLAALSLVQRWDEELAYSSRAVRDNYEMKSEWENLGRGIATDIQSDFTILMARQKVIDSHDAEKDITAAEQRIGMRAGLFLCQRVCGVCGKKPEKQKPPWWRLSPSCDVCGGN